MIERIPFGRTGHHSSRIIFGAAALGGMKQERADATLTLLDEFGLNHIDTAASYGDSELRLAPFLQERRKDFFLATKTGARTGDKAKAELERSLSRLGVDQVDLIQLHNLAQENQWQTALGPGGAVEALVQARDEGLVKHIGVTGHGTYIAAMHSKSLAAFDFVSVLLPYNFSMMQNPAYAADFETLYGYCQREQIAMQTIKAIAQRRWTEGDADKRFSWYKPIRDPEPLKRAVDYTLSRPGLFLNTTSDATLLRHVLEAASAAIEAPSDAQMRQDHDTLAIEPLFVRDVSDDVLLENDS
ncbi:MAG: aldo/keto reductase [Pseudomonadales bacterium]